MRENRLYGSEGGGAARRSPYPYRLPPGPALRWQREYWDTYMRDEEQERTAIRYIENNPVKSGYCVFASDWAFGSARFRDRVSTPGDASSVQGRIVIRDSANNVSPFMGMRLNRRDWRRRP